MGLLAGSISAFIVQSKSEKEQCTNTTQFFSNNLFNLFNKTAPFPSAYTLVPLLSVVMLVLYADRQTLVAKILSTKVFVGIGLIVLQPTSGINRSSLLQE